MTKFLCSSGWFLDAASRKADMCMWCGMVCDFIHHFQSHISIWFGFFWLFPPGKPVFRILCAKRGIYVNPFRVHTEPHWWWVGWVHPPCTHPGGLAGPTPLLPRRATQNCRPQFGNLPNEEHTSVTPWHKSPPNKTCISLGHPLVKAFWCYFWMFSGRYGSQKNNFFGLKMTEVRFWLFAQ